MPLKCWPLTIVCVEPWGFSLLAWFQPSRCVPGVSRMNFVKLRSRTGSSSSWRCSRMTATSARSVFSSWPSAAVTVTASVISPSSSRRSTFDCESTLTRTVETTAALKPLTSAFTS